MGSAKPSKCSKITWVASDTSGKIPTTFSIPSLSLKAFISSAKSLSCFAFVLPKLPGTKNSLGVGNIATSIGLGFKAKNSLPP